MQEKPVYSPETDQLTGLWAERFGLLENKYRDARNKKMQSNIEKIVVANKLLKEF